MGFDWHDHYIFYRGSGVSLECSEKFAAYAAPTGSVLLAAVAHNLRNARQIGFAKSSGVAEGVTQI